MDNISLIGWVAILFLVIFILTLNLWLFSASKHNKDNSYSSSNIIKRTSKILQNPFFEDNKKLEELSILTSALKNNESQAEDVDEEN